MRASALRSIAVRVMLVAFMAVGVRAFAGSPQGFDLPGHGALTLRVPDGWTAQTQQPPQGLPPSIFLQPQNGIGSGLLVTAIWPIAPATKIPDDDTLRSQVAAAAAKLAPQSVEGTLRLQEFAGSSGRAVYFAATDSAPKPGEFKYLTQGIIRVGDIALAFTVLNNDGEDAVVNAALEALRSAMFRPLRPR